MAADQLPAKGTAILCNPGIYCHLRAELQNVRELLHEREGRELHGFWNQVERGRLVATARG